MIKQPTETAEGPGSEGPTGKNFRRAKRHDDKTIAAVPSVWL